MASLKNKRIISFSIILLVLLLIFCIAIPVIIFYDPLQKTTSGRSTKRRSCFFTCDFHITPLIYNFEVFLSFKWVVFTKDDNAFELRIVGSSLCNQSSLVENNPVHIENVHSIFIKYDRVFDDSCSQCDNYYQHQHLH